MRCGQTYTQDMQGHGSFCSLFVCEQVCRELVQSWKRERDTHIHTKTRTRLGQFQSTVEEERTRKWDKEQRDKVRAKRREAHF